MYKVMIVDDEPNIRNGLRYLIDWVKYDFTICSVAKNGKDALEKMKLNYPDLIITDIKMPGLNGLGLIKYIRQSLHDKNMSFIILSGYDDFDYAKEAIKYNVSSYLLKPVDEEELINILQVLKKELSRENLFEFFYNRRVEEFSEKFNEIKQFDLLIDAIQSNQKLLMDRIVKDIFDNFDRVNLHPRLIKIYLDNFLIKLSKIIADIGGSIDRIIKNYRLFESDIANLNMAQLNSSLLEFSKECGLYIEELKQSCGVINKVKQYIKENYSKNIKLKEIAKIYYINSAYLGQLFKKETGLNFSHYLNDIRIENAKRLLKRTDLHIYQIADKVGYKNSDYFIIKFKDSEGCTPMEYKNEHNF